MPDCGCFSHNGFLNDRGSAEVAQRELELDGVDNMDPSRYLDRVGSVSASDEDEDLHLWTSWLSDKETEDQYLRFHHGS